MKRAGIFILVLMALLLTACGRQQAATQMLPTATPTLAGNVPTALIPTSAPLSVLRRRVSYHPGPHHAGLLTPAFKEDWVLGTGRCQSHNH